MTIKEFALCLKSAFNNDILDIRKFYKTHYKYLFRVAVKHTSNYFHAIDIVNDLSKFILHNPKTISQIKKPKKWIKEQIKERVSKFKFEIDKDNLTKILKHPKVKKELFEAFNKLSFKEKVILSICFKPLFNFATKINKFTILKIQIVIRKIFLILEKFRE